MNIWIFCSDTLFADEEYFSCFNCHISKEWDSNAVFFQWAEIMPENVADGPLTMEKKKKNIEDIS